LQNSLKTAHLIGLTPEYVANKIKRPKTVEKQVDCFTIREQKKIEQYVLHSPKDKLFGVVLCLYTGLRIGELLALTWKDIDFGKGLLFVSKTCHDGNDGQNHTRIIDSPKTVHSRRVIPLPKQILPLLKNLKKRSNCEYIIADGDKPVFVRSYQRTFELLLKKLGIAHKGFHSLRHTFATRALECGMDVKTLSELLGHKNATVTLNRYAHSLLEHKTDMMNRLGKLL
jgi:integrase